MNKKLKTHLKAFGITSAMMMFMCAPLFVGAAYTPQDIVFDPNSNAERNTGLGNASPPDIAGGIISWVLGLLALIAVILVIYGGFIWMLSRGNEEEVKKAKDILSGALFGLIIILASYGITNYVFGNLLGATQEGWNFDPSRWWQFAN